MKVLFATLLIVLGIALAVTRLSEPEMHAEVPIIYWVIDPAPVRAEHIRLFELWQIKSGHCTEHRITSAAELEAFRKRKWSPVIATAIREGNEHGAAVLDGKLPLASLPLTIRVPKTEMSLDASSNDMSKKIIQSVSGIASDVMEVYSDGNVQFMASGGLVADVTEEARRLGCGPDVTYPGMAASMMYEGRQYSFPRNPGTWMLWVNKETFARYRQPLPPVRWGIEEFEQRGKAFMAAANPPGGRRTVFFANFTSPFMLRRTFGLDVFNETMTRCILNDPRTARTYALMKKWKDVDHLFPTSVERAGFATEGGMRGGDGQLFLDGRFGMMMSGRYQLMQFRLFEQPMQLAVVEAPNGGIPCNIIGSGEATVYRGSKKLDLATLFLAFYASEDYSMQIVRDGDGLPPIPKYTMTEEYLRPKEYPNEWGCHEVFAADAIHCAISPSFSPFLQYNQVMQCEWTVSSAVDADRMTPEEGAREVEDRINRKMAANLADNPALKQKYDKVCAVQARIDAYRREGRPVPRPWVTNPYHQWLYEKNGWFEDLAEESPRLTGAPPMGGGTVDCRPAVESVGPCDS